MRKRLKRLRQLLPSRLHLTKKHKRKRRRL
jgi:hypothetical protein